MMLSILALNEYDSHLWDNFSVPTQLDKQTAVDYILESCAELELLYSDPEIIKYMIRNWVRTEGHIWEKLADTLDLEYNPIYNLDVTWEETRTPNLTHTRTPNLTETRTPNITETRGTNTTETRRPDLTETRTPNITETTTPHDTTTEKVAGYNSDTFQNARQTERGGTITEQETGNETNRTSGTDSTQTNISDTRKETGSETQTHTGTETEHETGTDHVVTRRYGNQGVTMTQDMITKEREVAKFNLYEYIANSFKNRFCLMVY